MSGKPKVSEAKVPVLKGKEAEDKILEYIKRMNRPFGAVDVSANLKGAVPKTATQKIMVALAEKGDLVQKTYGKTTFFVANQAILEDMPAEKLASLESQYKTIDEENKVLGVDMKIASGELAKLKNTPTDAELAIEVEGAAAAVSSTTLLRAFNIIQKWSRVSIKSLACFAYETGRIYTTNSASLPDSDRALFALSLLTCYVSAIVGSESPRTSRTTPRWYPSRFRSGDCPARRGLDQVEERMGAKEEDFYHFLAACHGLARSSTGDGVGGGSGHRV